MQHRNLANRYDQLNPRERLQMLIEAKAREDEAEEARLWQSCPRKTYQEIDDDFGRPYEAISTIALVFAADIYKQIGRLLMLRGIQGVIPLFLLHAGEEGAEREWLERNAEAEAAVNQDRKAEDEPSPADETAESARPGEATSIDDAEASIKRSAAERFDAMVRDCAEQLPRTTKTSERIFENFNRHFRSSLHGMMTGFDRFSSRALGVTARTLLQAFATPVLEHIDEFKVEEVAPDEGCAEDMEAVAWKTWKRIAFRN